MAEYLGKVTGLISGTELSNLCGFTSGELILTSDITWLKFSEDNKVFLVSSSCIRKKISYNDISEISCVFGKDIVINDKKYKCRLLTGANDSKDGPGGEWDRCIVTHVPQNEDSGWQGLYNICQEIINNKTVMRGYNAVDSFHNVVSAGTWNQGYGWKPVLEFYPLCKNSISSQDLGDKYFLEDINYIITGDTHTLTEKLDEISIRTLENQVSGTEYTLDLSAQWDSLAYGKHTIEIIATDSNSLSSTVTLTFNKIKEITQPISTESSLKELVNHIGNIDKDIDYLKFKLSDNLNGKGVECSDTDKMTSLIDKVDSLNVIKGSASPGEVLFILFDKKEYAPTKQTTPILTSQKVKIEGGYRVQFTCGSINNIVIKYGVKHMRNNTVVSQKMFNYSSYAYTSYTYDFSDVRKDDFFEFYAVGDASGTYLHMKDISVSCEVEI